MTHETQNRIENRARAMLHVLRKGLKRFGSGMMAAAVRYHNTPAKQEKPKAGKPKSLTDRRKLRKPKSLTDRRKLRKPKSLTDRRKLRRQKSDNFDRRAF